MALYAAYGSNMDAEQMLKRCPHSPTRGNGWLLDWRLTFGGEELGWEGALATIVEEPGCTVFGQLYDVSPLDERQLDGWEGPDAGCTARSDCASRHSKATRWRLDPAATVRHAAREDPGRATTDAVLLVAAVVGLVAVGPVIVTAGGSGGLAEGLQVGLGVASVILSWTVVHTGYTLRYARLYYSGSDGGVDFNEHDPPR